MKVASKKLETAFNLALSDLKKNLKEDENTCVPISKIEVLQKAREAVKAGKINLVESGNIERNINRGVPLAKAHRAILGLTDGAKIEGLNSPEQSLPAERMKSESTPGKKPAPRKVDMGTGSPAPVNPIVEAMAQGQKLSHSYQAINNEIRTVTGAEILRKCQELVKKGAMDLMKAGDVERAVNSGLPIRPEMLRFLFEV